MFELGESQLFDQIHVGSTPHPVTVTTRIITFLIGNPYKPSFETVTGWGVDLRYMWFSHVEECECVSAKLWNLGISSEPLEESPGGCHQKGLWKQAKCFLFFEGDELHRGWVSLADFWWIISVFVDPFVMQFVQLSLCRVESQQIM